MEFKYCIIGETLYGDEGIATTRVAAPNIKSF